MIYIILVILLILCVRGWFSNYVSATTLLWYLQEKNCPFPTEDEVKRGSQFVMKHILSDLFGNKKK